MKTNRLTKIFVFILALSIPAIACSISLPDSDIQVNPPEIKIPAIETPLAIPTIELPQLPEIIAPEIVLDEQSLLVELYKRVNPAVVNITVFFDQDGVAVPSGQGSGFVIDLDGNIVTNAHVVHGSDQLDVSFSNGVIRPAILVGEDLNSDLAVIRVDELPQGIEPLKLGNMDDIQVGETVLAIGNPFGLDGTLTRGIVSAVGRTIPALTPFSIPQAIQTDAPINPGNSGGPLLNLNGEVIGVNAQIETDGLSRSNSGVGFAIPVSIVSRVIPILIENGSIDWPWLGVRGTSLTPTISEAMKLSIEQGAYITEILPNGPALKAGLKGITRTETFNGRNVPVGGDVIVAIDGNPINSFDDLLLYIALEAEPGDEVILTVVRNGDSIEIPLKLEARPSSFSQ